jgi:hypothetical protein
MPPQRLLSGEGLACVHARLELPCAPSSERSLLLTFRAWTALESMEEELASSRRELEEGRAFAADLVGQLDERLEGAEVSA